MFLFECPQLAKQDAAETVYANVDHKGPEIHRMAKQMRRRNQDICGEMPVRNNQGELCLDDSERMKAWVEHYKSLLNIEFPWDEGALPDAPPVEGPPPPITDEMVTKALAKMKSGKAAGPSGIIVEMLKAAGSKGIVFLRELTKHGKIPEDWEMSFILNLYKGKGDALNRGNYRGLKLTEHVMKVMERIVDGMIREMIAIDEMQFAFVPGRGTTDAIFIIRQLQEKFFVQERSRWQEPDSVLCFCWSGESIWPCPPKGLVVGYEKGGGRRVDSASSTSYVQQCTQPSESRLWVQWGIRSWCWGTPGLCSQPTTLYHCAWGFI